MLYMYISVYIDFYSELYVVLLFVKVGINCSGFLGDKGLYMFYLFVLKEDIVVLGRYFSFFFIIF